MSTRSLLSTFTGGGGRGSDFWRPKETGQYPIRLYRFDSKAEDGTISKELCVTRKVHFGISGNKPMDCPVIEPGHDGCAVCRMTARLEASGTKEDGEKANRMRQVTQACFAFVLMADPTNLKLYECGFSVAQRIFLQIAKAGGWIGPYPEAKDPEEKHSQFAACFDAGLPKVCGPNGRDLIITYNKGAADKKKTYDVDMRVDGNKVLPFAEDDTVPNPEEVRKRMLQRMNEKGDE